MRSSARLLALAALLVAPSALAQTAPAAPPLDAARIAPHTLRATATLSVMGQTIEMASTRAVTREAGPDRWRVVDVTTLPPAFGGGTVADTAEVEAATFRPRLRRIGVETPMGAQTFRVAFTDSTATGEASGAGGTTPIRATFAGLVLGGALDLALAAMPLADGFAAAVQVFDPQQGAGVRPFAVRVAGREAVTVPAGTFEAFRVELTPTDGDAAGTQTLWITEATPRVAVRTEARLPDALGGGTITTVLTGRD